MSVNDLSNRQLVGPPALDLSSRSLTGGPTPLDPTLRQETTDVVATKLGTVGGVTKAASSLPGSVKADDPVQVGADVLRLTGEVLARNTGHAGSSVVAGANAITSVNKALQGDVYAATSAATTAIEKSATLSHTPLAAVANVALAGAAQGKVRETNDQLAVAARQALKPDAPRSTRTKAIFDVGLKIQQLALLYRTIGNGTFKGTQFVLNQAAKLKSLAPGVTKLQAHGAALAATRAGKTLVFLNKWIPLLNVAGLVMSGKTAIDVFKDPVASKTSKALAVGSVATAAISVYAGVFWGGWALFGLVAGSIAMDLALANARNLDKTTHDTDARLTSYAAHPGEGTRALGRYTQAVVPAIAQHFYDIGKKIADKLLRREIKAAPPPPLDPRTIVVR